MDGLTDVVFMNANYFLLSWSECACLSSVIAFFLYGCDCYLLLTFFNSLFWSYRLWLVFYFWTFLNYNGNQDHLLLVPKEFIFYLETDDPIS